MNYRRHQALLSVMMKRKNVFLSLSFLLSLIVLLQSVLLFKSFSNTKVVVVPTQLSAPAVFSKSGVSANLLADMTRYIADLYFNASMDNADYRLSQILNITDNQHHGQIKEKLLAQSEILSKNKANTVFYPKSVTPNLRDFSAIITGELDIYVGSALIQSLHKSYLARYVYHYGSLLLDSFDEIQA